jgi:hypothetical protein
MSGDPGAALRAARGQWLRVRAKVRALEASLAAAQHGLQRDARRCADPDMAVLVTQMNAERQAMQTLASELDERIAGVKRQCNTLEATHRETVVAAARTKIGRAD